MIYVYKNEQKMNQKWIKNEICEHPYCKYTKSEHADLKIPASNINTDLNIDLKTRGMLESAEGHDVGGGGYMSLKQFF